MIDFLKLHSCSVRIKGCHTLKWGTCSYRNTENSVKTENKCLFQASGTWWQTGAGGLVLPLGCTAYFGKVSYIVWLFLVAASIGLVYL